MKNKNGKVESKGTKTTNGAYNNTRSLRQRPVRTRMSFITATTLRCTYYYNESEKFLFLLRYKVSHDARYVILLYYCCYYYYCFIACVADRGLTT
jgi:hypothetical protein